MNVQCTSCKTVFRVDPSKVPAGGVRARCSICRAVFEVAAPSANGAAAAQAPVPAPQAAAPSPVAAPPRPVAVPTPTPASAAPQPAAAPPPAPAPRPTPSPAAAPSPAPVATPAPAPAPAAAPAPRPTPAPAPAPAAAGGRPSPFGASDPKAKARRLARALISDIAMYFPDRRDKALAAGTLKREFMDEIKKSWEEYVGQVGPEMARDTPFFREALNDILARGQAVF